MLDRFWDWLGKKWDWFTDRFTYLFEYLEEMIRRVFEVAVLFLMDMFSLLIDIGGDILIAGLELIDIDPNLFNLNRHLAGLGNTVLEILSVRTITDRSLRSREALASIACSFDSSSNP